MDWILIIIILLLLASLVLNIIQISRKSNTIIASTNQKANKKIASSDTSELLTQAILQEKSAPLDLEIKTPALALTLKFLTSLPPTSTANLIISLAQSDLNSNIKSNPTLGIKFLQELETSDTVELAVYSLISLITSDPSSATTFLQELERSDSTFVTKFLQALNDQYLISFFTTLKISNPSLATKLLQTLEISNPTYAAKVENMISAAMRSSIVMKEISESEGSIRKIARSPAIALTIKFLKSLSPISAANLLISLAQSEIILSDIKSDSTLGTKFLQALETSNTVVLAVNLLLSLEISNPTYTTKILPIIKKSNQILASAVKAEIASEAEASSKEEAKEKKAISEEISEEEAKEIQNYINRSNDKFTDIKNESYFAYL